MLNKGEEACNATNPLKFWANNGMMAFFVLAGIAARVLSGPALSASVEQLFSFARRVVTTARARLNFRHVNELFCLHQWLIDEGMVTKEAWKAKEKHTKAFAKLAFLNLLREVEEPEDIERDDEDDDDQDNYNNLA